MGRKDNQMSNAATTEVIPGTVGPWTQVQNRRKVEISNLKGKGKATGKDMGKHNKFQVFSEMEKEAAGETSGGTEQTVIPSSVVPNMQMNGETMITETTDGEAVRNAKAVKSNVEHSMQMEEGMRGSSKMVDRKIPAGIDRKTQTGEGGNRGKKTGEGKALRNETLGGGLKPGKGSLSFKRRKEKNALTDMTNNFNRGIAENVGIVDSVFKEEMMNIATNLKVNHEKEMGSKKTKLAKEDVKTKPPDILFSSGGGSEGMIIERDGEKEESMMEEEPECA